MFCYNCGGILEEEEKCPKCERGTQPLEAVLEVPSPFGDKEYEMKKVDENMATFSISKKENQKYQTKRLMFILWDKVEKSNFTFLLFD